MMIKSKYQLANGENFNISLKGTVKEGLNNKLFRRQGVILIKAIVYQIPFLIGN